MNQIPAYQHPFVDVFKITKLTEWQGSQKEGDVTEVYDKQLAKNVIKVSGVTPASNYFQVPQQSQLSKKPLGLIGKYVYSIVNVPAGKSFVLHLDYILNETRHVRLSISNIFKEYKNLNGNSIQIPLQDNNQAVPFGKWTIICINVMQIFEQANAFAAGQNKTFYMRSLQVTANVQVKGIYTSDIKYTVQTLPKDMALKVLKGQEWFALYSWFEYPFQEGPGSAVENEIKENNLAAANGLKKSNIRPASAKKVTNGKSVKFNGDGDQSEIKPAQEEIKASAMEVEHIQTPNQDRIEKTIKDIDDIKNQYQLNIEEKQIQPKAEITFYYNQDESMYPKAVQKVNRTLKKEEQFVLKPNPIMKLDRTIGIHPRYQAGQVFFNKDAKLSREILYTQANLLLGYQHSTQRQRLFYDHQTTSIDHFYVEELFAFTVTRGLQQDDAKDFEIAIWDTQDSTLIFSFKPPMTSLHSLTLNAIQNDEPQYLCVSGRDFQKRDLIIIYNFTELLLNKRVEIYARQLCDFDLLNIRFNDANQSSLIACGRENIRFFKIKNGHLPGQLVTLNNTARGKSFNKSIVDYITNDKGLKRATNVFVSTNCGLLYIINYQSRQVEKIVQIHEDKITSLIISQNRNFILSASINGFLRLWSPDFSKLISEVNTQQPILSCDVNHKEIVVLGGQGTLSLLDMQESTFNVILRSHLDTVQDLCFNKPSGKIVSVGLDQRIYIWNGETMDVVTEFTTSNDVGLKLSSSQTDPTVAIGFKSGFIRIFDLSFENSGKLMAETMIFDAPVMDLQYSPDNRFLAVFYKSCRIVIFSVEKGYQPVKSIDYEFPNENYFSLSFSSDSKYLANISSNANNVTIWETKNFSLKFHIDVTGDVVSKIKFAPNGKDLVLLTTSSKLKFYRYSFSEIVFIKEIYGVTDLECQDFEIAPNNKFIACCGREGVIKVYDYFMRGSASPSSQGFIGHFKYPKRVYWQEDMRFMFSIGEGNGIFRWSFFGEKEMPSDLSRCYEELEAPKIDQKHPGEDPVFNHDDLLRMTNLQIDGQYQQLSDAYNQIPTMPDIQGQTLTGLDTLVPQPRLTIPQPQQHSQHLNVQYNALGYRFEQYDIELKKVLQCSIGASVKNNLVWHKDRRYIAYTSANIVIVEDLNQEKTQTILKESNDKIYQLKFSTNGRTLLGFTRRGELDGFPCLYFWDSATLKKLNQIAINDEEVISCEFNKNSNLLLVLSKTQGVSTIAVWDYLDGHKDILCKSQLPMNLVECKWNYYLGDALEFVTISDRCYHFWKMTPNLALQYQEGDFPKKHQSPLFASSLEHFTACDFAVPDSGQINVYMLLGLSSGTICVVDSRCNQFMYTVKVIDGPIRQIFTSSTRIIVEGVNDSKLHAWPQGQNGYDRGDPQTYFLDKEQTLTIDGFSQATSYDESMSECVISTSSGTIWFASWLEMATIKIKSCHSPQFALTSADYKYLPPGQFQVDEQAGDFHQFDQNYLIATSSADGVIKCWNMFDSEFVLQFIVPKEECCAIAMHQFKPYMVAAFTDGFIRFFEINNKARTLGRCQVNAAQEGSQMVDHVVSLKILPSGNHILAASKHGQILLIYVQQWEPLALKLEPLASMNTQINSFDVSFLEPYNKWLVGTCNGKVIVYNRKDFNSYQQEIFNEDNPPKFNYMDSFNLLDYVDNQFTESKRTNTLDHYYSTAKRTPVTNLVAAEHFCESLFSNADLTLHISYIAKAPHLFIRNFELHQCVKRVELASIPISLGMLPNNAGNTCWLVVLQANNVVKMIDMVNTENTSEIATTHEEVKIMKVCYNGKYILTGGSRGDVCLWQIKKREVSPEEVTQIAQALY